VAQTHLRSIAANAATIDDAQRVSVLAREAVDRAVPAHLPRAGRRAAQRTRGRQMSEPSPALVTLKLPSVVRWIFPVAPTHAVTSSFVVVSPTSEPSGTTSAGRRSEALAGEQVLVRWMHR
jgi:hypothetical protein